MKNPISLTSIILSLLLFFISCERDKGEKGDMGLTGTANVIYSDWFQFATADWGDTTILSSHGTSPAKRVNYPAPGITQDILDQGLVLTYFKMSANDYPKLLPYTWVGTSQYVLSYMPKVGGIIYYIMRLDGGASNTNSPTAYYRYVIVPGGTVASSANDGFAMNRLKSLSYEQAVTLFNIPGN